MFYLVEQERLFVLKTDRFLDKEDFQEFSKDFKILYLFYDIDLKGWKIQKNKCWETIQYITKKLNIEVDLKGIILNQFSNEIEETIFNRKVVFDKSVLKVNLFDYQLEDVAWALKRSRGYIASDPGIGKTIEAISIFSHLFKNKQIDGILILVKNNLTYHWKREILQYSNQFTENDFSFVTNQNKRDFFDSGKVENSKIIICPNHLLKDVIESYSSFSLKKKWNKNEICLIIDESHEFKNPKAQRTKSLDQILEYCSYRYFLSATPAINGFADWYNQLRMLDKSIIPMSEKSFCFDIASQIGDKYNPFAIKRYNSDKVKEYINRFKPWVIKRVKSELPEVKSKQLIKPIYFEMSQKHQNIYNLIKTLSLEKLKENPNGSFSYSEIQNKFPYLCLTVDNPHLLENKIKEEDRILFKPLENLLKHWKYEENAKIQYLDEFLKSKIKTEKEKVIVFDTHPKTLDELAQRYKDYHPLVMHGQTGDDLQERQRKVDEFNDITSNNKLFLVNVQVGGTGYNLQKACSTTIFFNLPFDSVLTRQSLDRTFRVNSVRDSFVEILVFGRSLDEQRCKINLSRIDFNDNFLKDDKILLKY